MLKALFPGSFDPLTNGHLDIIMRANHIFDQLIIAVSHNISKDAWFSAEQRCELIKRSTENLEHVKVIISDGLTVDLAQSMNIDVLVRGIRDGRDFEYEKSIANLNRHLSRNIETIFLTTDPQYESISSSMLKEIFHFGGDIQSYVPAPVLDAMRNRKAVD